MPVTIPAVGTAEPLVTVQVRAQVTGQLGQVHFAEGQEVRKGDTLFTLDARPFEAALRQAEAVLARDTAQSKNAKSQQARYKELFDKGLIPRDQYETQDATAVGARSDAGGGSVAGREREAQPAIHDHQGADLRPHGRACRCMPGTSCGPTTRPRWWSSIRSRRSTSRSRCLVGTCPRSGKEQAKRPLQIEVRDKSGRCAGRAADGAAGAGTPVPPPAGGPAAPSSRGRRPWSGGRRRQLHRQLRGLRRPAPSS